MQVGRQSIKVNILPSSLIYIHRLLSSGSCCTALKPQPQPEPICPACRNIEIVGNTVRNCPYIPTNNMPAITVYVGGSSYMGMPGPEATAQLQQGITIARNAVYSAGGPGISVTNSRDIEIVDNVLSDCEVSGYAQGSIYLNAVSEGRLRVEMNAPTHSNRSFSNYAAAS